MSFRYDDLGKPIAPESMTDAEAMRAIVHGTKALRGIQVLSFERACRECAEACSVDPVRLDEDGKQRVRWLLEYLGYERQWYSEAGGSPMVHRWGRGYWPYDLAVAASKAEPITYMVSMS